MNDELGECLTSICSTSTGEHDDLVSCCSPGVEIHAGLSQGVDQEHFSCLIVVFAFGDDIPLLPCASITCGDLNWVEIGSEIAREFVHEETFPIGGLMVSGIIRLERELTLIAVAENAFVAVVSAC